MKLSGARRLFISLMIAIFIFLNLQISNCTCAPSQVSLTLKYSIIGGGNGYSLPIISYISNGAQQSHTLSLQSTTYHLDINTQWGITNPLSGSLPNERWQTNQNTAGMATLNQNSSLAYYHQFQVQFSYDIHNGGSGFLPPTVSYTSFGSTITNNTVVNVWVDSGSTYSYINPLTGSTQSETWITLTHTGTITSSTQISPDYYHQYYVVFDYSINGGGNPSAPSVTYSAFGSHQLPIQAGSGQPAWVDAQSSYTYSPNPLTGSNTNERWQASSMPSGTVSYSTTIRPVYYHQLLLTLAYTIIGGGSPIPPSFTSALFGSSSSQTLTKSPANYWFDSSASWIEVSTLPGSTSTERWSTGQSFSGIINSPKTILFSYYHQYNVAFNYKVNGGTGFSPPIVNIISFAATSSTSTNSSVWSDANAPYSYQNPLTGSSTLERWSTSTPNGNIIAPGTISTLYYQQFNVIFSFTILYGGTPIPPPVKYVSFGTSSTKETTSTSTSTWVDANTIYTYPQTLIESSNSERWQITPPNNGSISGSVTLSPAYLHQYFVTIEQNSLLAGSASQSSGWYNSTSHIPISPMAAEGWRFEGWTGSGEGSYTGPSETIIMNVSAPMTETMIFYPGLKINVTGEGYITYTLELINGTVNSWNFTIVYVPIGTEVGLSENPTSFLYSFTNWTGEVNSTSNFVSLTINRPLNEQANFGYNYPLIGLIVGLEAAIAIITYFVTSKRRIIKIKLTKSVHDDDDKSDYKNHPEPQRK